MIRVMTVPAPPPTRTAWVDEALRRRIVDGEELPGERLVIASLATLLGVSPTPVREALARLALEGFVELTPHGSATVAPITVEEVIEIYRLRRLLEPPAIEASVAAAGPDDHRSWRDAFDALGTGADRVTNLTLHTGFHRSLLAACPSRWHLRTVDPLLDHAQRAVVLLASGRSGGYDVAADHRPLLEHCLARRADAAASELDRHLERTVHTLVGRNEAAT